MDVFLGIGVIVACPSFAQERQHQRKTLACWKEELQNQDPNVRCVAARATARSGPTGFRVLLEMLNDKHRDARNHGVSVLLGRMRSEAKAAIPALTELPRNKDALARGRAAEALGEMGP